MFPKAIIVSFNEFSGSATLQDLVCAVGLYFPTLQGACPVKGNAKGKCESDAKFMSICYSFILGFWLDKNTCPSQYSSDDSGDQRSVSPVHSSAGLHGCT
jgi:hypothetical protein